VVFLIFVGAQLLRMRYEEAVLRRAYPEYDAYARRTARLIPFVI
jgi:protein-S-isoprenylcysteine O-methyltransferase Ste14